METVRVALLPALSVAVTTKLLLEPCATEPVRVTTPLFALMPKPEMPEME